MARGRREIPPCCKSYGFPLYFAACVPFGLIAASTAAPANNESVPDQDQHQDQVQQDKEQEQQEAAPKPSPDKSPDRLLVALGGGGGAGRSGVPNAIVLSAFDFATQSLSDHPVCRVGTGEELPYRMAMHPGGEGFVCSFSESCRWFEWDFPENEEHLAMKSSDKILTKLEDVGVQLALAFNLEGSILAAGGEDGHLRVFKWPSMETILDQTKAHPSVKDLDFSFDGKYLASSGDSGPSRVWDLTLSSAVANLQREDGEEFGFCRFSQSMGDNQMLHITAMHGGYGKIISWNVNSWKRIGSKSVGREGICAFNVSSDGKFLAIGTAEGNIVVVNSANMQLLTTVKNAHLAVVTALVFSRDSRALVSASLDYTARVTLVESKKKSGINMLLVILIILLSPLVYYFMANQRIL